METNIGKAKVKIKSEGCFKCGTTFSSGWSVYKTIPVTIGPRAGMIDINICFDCSETMKKGLQ